MHFSSSAVSPRAAAFVLSPALGREGARWGRDVQPVSLLTHGSAGSCWRSRWRNAPFSSAGQCPVGPSGPLRRLLRPRLPTLNEVEVTHRVCSTQGIPQDQGYFTARRTIAEGVTEVTEGCTLPGLVSISLQPGGDLPISVYWWRRSSSHLQHHRGALPWQTCLQG